MQAAKKVVLITGANKGIGFEVARQIAKVGWTVLAAARNEELGRQAVARLLAEGLDVHFVPINLNDQKIAVTAAETIRNQFGKLDLLINNAAIAGAGDGPPGKVSIETVETVFHANFVGTIAVTQAMLPLPQDAGKAQIINVSSLLGSVSLQNDPNWEYNPGEAARLLRFEGRVQYVHCPTRLRTPRRKHRRELDQPGVTQPPT